MARSFSYNPAIAPADGRGPHIRVRLNWTGVSDASRAAHLADMARTIPANTVGPACRVFAAMDGYGYNLTPHTEGEDIVLPLPQQAVAEPWRLAAMLNLIDFAVAQDDPDIRLVESATIHADGASALGVDDCFADLAGRLNQSRAYLKAFLPEGFWLDDYEEDNWPEEADEYDFAVELTLGRPLSASEAAAVAPVLGHIEEMIAWMAFALDGSAPEWQGNGSMLFAGRTVVEGHLVRIDAERPPSDISLAVAMVVRIAETASGGPIAKWTIDIGAA